MNAATDNPLVFPDSEEVLSGGNFHGHPVAVAMDLVAVALAGLCGFVERRIERLVNPQLSELPAFLVEGSGLNSGLMMAQISAAALVAEARLLASDSFTNDKIHEQSHVSYTYTKKSPREGLKVRLRVRDDKGAYANSSAVTIHVGGRLSPPEAAFTYVAPDLNVMFKDTSESDEDNNGQIVSYEWDFNTADDSDGNGNPADDVD